MQNIPKTIYLQIGKDCPTDDGEDFNKLYGVTWCAERINENDIEFVLKEDKPNPEQCTECGKVLKRGEIKKGVCDECDN